MKNLKWQLKARNWLGERPIMKEIAVEETRLSCLCYLFVFPHKHELF